MIIGSAMLYVIVHFYVVQFTKKYSERTTYEKFLTIGSMILIALIIMGIGVEKE